MTEAITRCSPRWPDDHSCRPLSHLHQGQMPQLTEPSSKPPSFEGFNQGLQLKRLRRANKQTKKARFWFSTELKEPLSKQIKALPAASSLCLIINCAYQILICKSLEEKRCKKNPFVLWRLISKQALGSPAVML